jgi:uncharacterized protein YbaR (Trm112 family)
LPSASLRPIVPEPTAKRQRAATLYSRGVSAALHVEVLVCAACGAAVPLGDGDVLACPHCRAAVPLPPAHRALRDAVHGDEADRQQARELYARLGTPPGALAQLVASSGF